jgi:hypothetical protein
VKAVSSHRPKERARKESSTKKALILELARGLGKPRFTPAEIEQIRRQLIAKLGAEGKTSADYIATVLQEAAMRVVMSTRSDTEGRYEEELCLVRLDELLRKFAVEGERAAAERVREVARLGRRRAEMIAHNHKVAEAKRAEKTEIAQWFALWLETPDAFFDWLEVRKKSPGFQQMFSAAENEDI